MCRILSCSRIFAVCAALFGSSCGQDTAHFRDVETKIDNPESPRSARDASAQRKGFNLIDSRSFLIVIEGCKSGYGSQVTAEAPRILLYRGDRDCLAKLINFEKDGKVFRSVPGKGFTTHQYGDTAVFMSEDGKNFLNVRVTQQLSNPTAPADSVNFAFTEVRSSMQKLDILRTVFGSKGSVRGNLLDAPVRLTVRKAELVNLDYTHESAQMVYKLECEVKIQKGLLRPDYDGDSFCGLIRLKDLKYVLIKDSVGGMPCPTRAKDCDKYFSGKKALSIADTDIIPPGTQGLVNGGFYTKRDLKEALTSPSDLARNPEMLLIIGNDNSYVWFNLDFEVQDSFELAQIAWAGMHEDE